MAVTPCSTCPYRRSAPVGIWDEVEFDNLKNQDCNLLGAAFLCHLDDDSMCRGWLADQKRRDIPSISLRLLLRNEKFLKTFEKINENDPDLYGSIEEMAEVNKGRAFPLHSAKARKILFKK